MNLNEFEELAIGAVDLYLGRDWSFEWSNTKRILGMCDESINTVFVSKPSFEFAVNVADIIDTLYHEIAHGIVGCEHGHDQVWRAKALELGATPKASSSIPFKDGFYKYYTVLDAETKFVRVNNNGYHAKPRKSLRTTRLVSDPVNTLGKLYYISEPDWVAYTEGKLTNIESCIWQ